MSYYGKKSPRQHSFVDYQGHDGFSFVSVIIWTVLAFLVIAGIVAVIL